MTFHDPKTVPAAAAAIAARSAELAVPAYFTPEPAAQAAPVKALSALDQMFGYYA
ncbi:hypothetical protein [Frigidibacter sp. MR17.24]|uniref:hypothetical protein n=1 Tax=Frigidibacter sp. MR17.24 TaxID=3127345 RepID=UPI003012BD80